MCSASPNRCDDDGHLIHLSLSSEGLDCKFPGALADMRALTRLDLTFNRLDGRCAAGGTKSACLGGAAAGGLAGQHVVSHGRVA